MKTHITVQILNIRDFKKNLRYIPLKILNILGKHFLGFM